jgi:tRNA(Leu) C34 or U34 (ribose-2'-O)-methylase TrmL
MVFAAMMSSNSGSRLDYRIIERRHGRNRRATTPSPARSIAFEDWRRATGRRLVLLTTKAGLAYTAFRYFPGDILLVGRESAGVPVEVHAAADACLVIPLKPPMRSLNVAVAAAMVAGEAPRQLGGSF